MTALRVDARHTSLIATLSAHNDIFSWVGIQALPVGTPLGPDLYMLYWKAWHSPIAARYPPAPAEMTLTMVRSDLRYQGLHLLGLPTDRSLTHDDLLQSSPEVTDRAWLVLWSIFLQITPRGVLLRGASSNHPGYPYIRVRTYKVGSPRPDERITGSASALRAVVSWMRRPEHGGRAHSRWRAAICDRHLYI